MWLYNGKYIKDNISWVDTNNVRHPPNWGALWSDADKEAAGMVKASDPEKPSDIFYKNISRNADGSWASTELDIADLKTNYVASTKRRAHHKLADNDWQEIAKLARSRAIDSDVATYRAAVLTACETIEGKINACSSLADFKKLFVVPSGGKAPIYDWPDEL
jgi:hypothetical protein